jgi:sulfotransferase
MKKIYFMGGLPRSGSTLLTCLLNQNPTIFASHASEVLTIMNKYKYMIADFEVVKLGLMTENYFSVYRDIPQSFYKNETKPIIIDKNRGWGAPYSLEIANDFTDNIKIIYVYRPILEVLASYIQLLNKNPKTNHIDLEIRNQDFLTQYYRPIDDVRCDYLMRPNSVIDTALLALGVALKEEYKHLFHVVNYDDLVTNTQETLSGIYNFLGIDDYTHDLENLESYWNSEDANVFGLPGLHEVRSQIKKESVPPERVLSNYVMEKYKNITKNMGMNEPLFLS